MTEPHEGDSDDDDSRHVCIIAVFLLVRLLYLLIHSLDYLFRSIQTLMVLAGLIDLVAVPPSIACCSPNPPPKPTPSQHFMHVFQAIKSKMMRIFLSI